MLTVFYLFFLICLFIIFDYFMFLKKYFIPERGK